MLSQQFRSSPPSKPLNFDRKRPIRSPVRDRGPGDARPEALSSSAGRCPGRGGLVPALEAVPGSPSGSAPALSEAVTLNAIYARATVGLGLAVIATAAVGPSATPTPLAARPREDAPPSVAERPDAPEQPRLDPSPLPRLGRTAHAEPIVPCPVGTGAPRGMGAAGRRLDSGGGGGALSKSGVRRLGSGICPFRTCFRNRPARHAAARADLNLRGCEGILLDWH